MLEKKTETYGDILVSIKKKLPNEIKRNLTRQNGNKEWHFDSLRMAILNEIDILEAGKNSCSDYVVIDSSLDNNHRCIFHECKVKSTSKLWSITHQITCLLCKDEYNSTDFNVVTDKERKLLLFVMPKHAVALWITQYPNTSQNIVITYATETSLCQNVEKPPTAKTSDLTSANKTSSPPVTDKAPLHSISSLHIVGSISAALLCPVFAPSREKWVQGQERGLIFPYSGW